MIIEIRDVPQGTGVQRIQIDLMPIDPMQIAQAAAVQKVPQAVVHYNAQPNSLVPPVQPDRSESVERPTKPIPQEMTDLEL